MHFLYPAIKPYTQHELKVSDLHTLYIEETGNPEGIPVIVLHTGPGASSTMVIFVVFLTHNIIELFFLINAVVDVLPHIWKFVKTQQLYCWTIWMRLETF